MQKFNSNVECNFRFKGTNDDIVAMLAMQSVADKVLAGTRGDKVYIGKLDGGDFVTIRCVSQNGCVLTQRHFDNKSELIGFCKAIDDHIYGSIASL